MKKTICMLLLASLTYAFVQCQESKYSFSSGIGYYNDTFGNVDGQVFWIEANKKLKNDFSFKFRYSLAYTTWELTEGFFKDYKTMDLRQYLSLVFCKSIRISENHFLEPGFGFLIKKEFYMVPGLSLIPSGASYTVSTSYSDTIYEIGGAFILDYKYILPGEKYIGLRTEVNIIWTLGLEGVSFGPLFGIMF